MLDVLISGLISGNSYVLIAIGMSLIFGVANLVNFAHGSIFAIGSMVGWWFVAVLGWPLWATLLGTILISAVLGLLVEYICVRPLTNQPPIATLLSTLAASLVLDYSSQLIFGSDTRRFPSLLPTDNIQFGGIRIGTLDVTIFAVSLVSVVALWTFLKYTRLGRAIRATTQDRDAARQMGISVGTIQGLTFAIASAFGGIAGVLVGMYYSNVSPINGFSAGLEGFAAATLGGLGSLPGAVLGGLVLGVAEAFGVTWFGDAVRQFITFAVLLLAYQWISLDYLSNGRTIFVSCQGAQGSGLFEEEFAAFGIDPASRMRRQEEAIEILRLTSSQEHVSYEGVHNHFKDTASCAAADPHLGHRQSSPQSAQTGRESPASSCEVWRWLDDDRQYSRIARRKSRYDPSVRQGRGTRTRPRFRGRALL